MVFLCALLLVVASTADVGLVYCLEDRAQFNCSDEMMACQTSQSDCIECQCNSSCLAGQTTNFTCFDCTACVRESISISVIGFVNL